MNYITTTTKVGDVEYEVEIGQYEDLAEAVDDLGEAGVLGVVNAKREQDSKQGPKGGVRKAIEEHGAESQEVQDAIAEAQAATRDYNFGSGGGGRRGRGPTQAQMKELGKAQVEYFAEHGKMPTQKELTEIAEELGIQF